LGGVDDSGVLVFAWRLVVWWVVGVVVLLHSFVVSCWWCRVWALLVPHFCSGLALLFVLCVDFKLCFWAVGGVTVLVLYVLVCFVL